MTRRILLFVVCLSFSTGCSSKPTDPTIAPVSGNITLDDNPLANATIMFVADGQNRPAVGKTDSSGNYTLYYTSSLPGAKIGHNTVSIATATEGDDGKFSKEVIPKRYFKPGALTAEIKADQHNTVDFKLTTE